MAVQCDLIDDKVEELDSTVIIDERDSVRIDENLDQKDKQAYLIKFDEVEEKELQTSSVGIQAKIYD